MRKLISFSLAVLYLAVISCSGPKNLSVADPEPQSSAKIILKDGTSKEGILLKRDGTSLIYVDSKSHKKESIPIAQIRQMTESEIVYDFSGKRIPGAEISEHKSMSKTLLYGAGGLVLGAAAGIGLGIVIVSADSTQTGAANAAIGVFGVLGAYVFGSMGADQDYNEAVFDARKARYLKEKKQMDSERKKLDELKQEKERLLKKKAEKEGKN